jgi:hypothetical protein
MNADLGAGAGREHHRLASAPADTETPNATREDRLRYLGVLRAAVRYRNPSTGRRHFCHSMPYRPHYLRRLLELRAVLKWTDEPTVP